MDPFTIVLLLMLGFAVLLVAGIGMRKPIDVDRTPVLPRLVAGAALVGAFIAALIGIVTVVLTFVGDRVTLAVPVITSIEIPPSELRANPAVEVLSGTAQQTLVPLTVAGLDLVTRSLVALHLATLGAVVVTVLIVIARIAQQSMAAEPFSTTPSRLLVGAGLALTVGATVSQVFQNLAAARVFEQLFFLRPDAIDGFVNGSPTWVFEVWPVGVGLVLIVVARLIRNGERLQRDTAGLV